MKANINGKVVELPLKLYEGLMRSEGSYPVGDFHVKVDGVSVIGDASAIAATLGLDTGISQPVLTGLEYAWSVQ